MIDSALLMWAVYRRSGCRQRRDSLELRATCLQELLHLCARFRAGHEWMAGWFFDVSKRREKQQYFRNTQRRVLFSPFSWFWMLRIFFCMEVRNFDRRMLAFALSSWFLHLAFRTGTTHLIWGSTPAQLPHRMNFSSGVEQTRCVRDCHWSNDVNNQNIPLIFEDVNVFYVISLFFFKIEGSFRFFRISCKLMGWSYEQSLLC